MQEPRPCFSPFLPAIISDLPSWYTHVNIFDIGPHVVRYIK